jgi:hypothetical protein
LPSLGLAGSGPTAKTLGLLVQQGNFLLYLPVAMLVSAQALQSFIDPSLSLLSGCTDYWIFIVALLCLATTQLRSLSNVTILSLISLVCVLATMLCVVLIVDDTPYDDKTEALKVGNADMAWSASHESIKGWTQFALGISLTAWAYAPSFLTAELSNPNIMAKVEDFPKAIWLSAALNCAMFACTGLFVVNRWGATVNDPIMLGTAENFGLWDATALQARVCNFFWFFACIISYALDSVPLGRACQRAWAPGVDVDDWSAGACFKCVASSRGQRDVE